VCFTPQTETLNTKGAQNPQSDIVKKTKTDKQTDKQMILLHN